MVVAPNDKMMCIPVNNTFGEIAGTKIMPIGVGSKVLTIPAEDDSGQYFAYRPMYVDVGERVVCLPCEGDPYQVVAINCESSGINPGAWVPDGTFCTWRDDFQQWSFFKYGSGNTWAGSLLNASCKVKGAVRLIIPFSGGSFNNISGTWTNLQASINGVVVWGQVSWATNWNPGIIRIPIDGNLYSTPATIRFDVINAHAITWARCFTPYLEYV